MSLLADTLIFASVRTTSLFLPANLAMYEYVVSMIPISDYPMLLLLCNYL